GAEALQALLQASLLGLQHALTETRCGLDQLECDIAEALYCVVDKSTGTAKQASVLAAHCAPHKRTIPGVELLHPTVGLDHLGSGETNPALFCTGKRRTTPGNQPPTPIATSAPANQPDNF